MNMLRISRMSCKSSLKVGRPQEQTHKSSFFRDNQALIWLKRHQPVPLSSRSTGTDFFFHSKSETEDDWPCLKHSIECLKWRQQSVIWTPVLIFWLSASVQIPFPLEHLKEKLKPILVRMKGRKSSEKGNGFKREIPLHLSSIISYLEVFWACS